MIVWGGGNASTYFGDGGVYDPAGDSWTVTATMAEPQARYIHTAVWTGSRMIVWGGRGLGSSGYVNDGGQYEPVGNTWTATTTTGAPAGRYFHTAVWAGSSMIVWGGDNSGSILNDGGVWSTVSLYMKN
jgi:hypothetical protein